MEVYQLMIHGNFPRPSFLPHLHHLYAFPENYVHWNQTPNSHIFTADLPGVSDLNDSGEEEETRRRRNFVRKFRLPAMVNLDGISAGYEEGVLTVRVPRSLVNRRPRPEDVVVDLSEDARNSVARAA